MASFMRVTRPPPMFPKRPPAPEEPPKPLTSAAIEERLARVSAITGGGRLGRTGIPGPRRPLTPEEEEEEIRAEEERLRAGGAPLPGAAKGQPLITAKGAAKFPLQLGKQLGLAARGSAAGQSFESLFAGDPLQRGRIGPRFEFEPEGTAGLIASLGVGLIVPPPRDPLVPPSKLEMLAAIPPAEFVGAGALNIERALSQLRVGSTAAGLAAQRAGPAARRFVVSETGAVNLGKEGSALRIKEFLVPKLQQEYTTIQTRLKKVGIELDAVAGPRQDEFFVVLERNKKGVQGLSEAQAKAAVQGLSNDAAQWALGTSGRQDPRLFFRNFEEVNAFLSTEGYRPSAISFPLRKAGKPLFEAEAFGKRFGETPKGKPIRPSKGSPEKAAEAMQRLSGEEGFEVVSPKVPPDITDPRRIKAISEGWATVEEARNATPAQLEAFMKRVEKPEPFTGERRTPHPSAPAVPEAPSAPAARGPGAPPPAQPPAAGGGIFDDAKQALRRFVAQEEALRLEKTPQAEIAAGRKRQAAGIKTELQQAVEAGEEAEQAALGAIRGAKTGPLRQTFAEPVNISPEHRAAFFEELNRRALAGELQEFEHANTAVALSKALDRAPQGLMPFEQKLLRSFLGDDVAEGLLRGTKAAEDLALQRRAYLANLDDMAKARSRAIDLARRENERMVKAGEANDAKALREFNAADKREMELARQNIADAERRAASAARAEARSEQAATRAESAMRERLDKMTPNDEMLLGKAREIAGGDTEVVAAIDYWLQGNRVMLDSIKDADAAGRLMNIIGGTLAGNLNDSYMTTLWSRRSLLSQALATSGLDPKDAANLVDALVQAELRGRYGANPAKWPRQVVRAQELSKGASYEATTGAVAVAVERAKNAMFGADFAVFGIQGLTALHRGGVALFAGYTNRLLSLLHLPNARALMTEANLPRQMQKVLDGTHTGIGGSIVRPEQGMPFRYLGGPGRFVDHAIMSVIEPLTNIQFRTILGHIGDVAYEGNLTLLHITGKNIRNPAVRAEAAESANTIRSFGRAALQANRRNFERVMLTSPSMTRSQVDFVLQMARFFSPKATSTERILAASAIVSATGSVLLVGKFLNDYIGLTDFEFDPSKPGFGQITTKFGRMSLFPQESVALALSRSFRAIQAASGEELAKVWGRLAMGRGGTVVSRTIAAATGSGFEPGEGFVFGELSQRGRLLNLAPIPPIVQSIALEGTTPSGAALEIVGLSVWPESQYSVSVRRAQELGMVRPDGLPIKAYGDLSRTQTIALKDDPQVKDAIGKARPTEVDKIQAKRKTDEVLLQKQYDNNAISGSQYREAYYRILSDASIATGIAVGDREFKETSDPFKLALNEYYRLVEQSQGPGLFDYEAFERGLTELRGQWGAKVSDYVEENTGIREHDSKMAREFDAFRKRLREANYWDAERLVPAFKKDPALLAQYLEYKELRTQGQKKAWLQAGGDIEAMKFFDDVVGMTKEQIREDNPDLDAGLVKFYGGKGKTTAGRLEAARTNPLQAIDGIGSEGETALLAFGIDSLSAFAYEPPLILSRLLKASEQRVRKMQAQALELVEVGAR